VTPAARLAAAAEVLDRVAGSRAPAEGVLQAWGRSNRYAGSGDRRAIGERVFACLRARGRLAAAGGAEDGRTLVLFSLRLLDRLEMEGIEALFSGVGHAPAALTQGERARLSAAESGAGRLPGFVEADFRRKFGAAWAEEGEALLNARAPLDVRVNGVSREAVAAELAAAGFAPEPTPWSAWGLRLPAGSDVKGTPAWREGRLEVQDEGSQIAAWLAGARAGELVVDYCAGGGGKTLALAQSMALRPSWGKGWDGGAPDAHPPTERGTGPGRALEGGGRVGGGRPPIPGPSPTRGEGRLVACDVNPARLEAIRPRLARAGVEAELRGLGPEGEGVEDLEGRADLVFVDAPCSGSGTWRRHPEAAWRLTEAEVARFHALQVQVLGRAAKLVRPGGRLVYVTCAVLGRENEDSALAFAEEYGDFGPLPVTVARTEGLTDAGVVRLAELAGGGHQVQLTPARTGTDGFFAALWERR